MVTDAMMPGMSGRDLAAYFMRSRLEMRVLSIAGYAADRVLNRPGVGVRRKVLSPEALHPTGLFVQNLRSAEARSRRLPGRTDAPGVTL
jgi:hypothetical protein